MRNGYILMHLSVVYRFEAIGRTSYELNGTIDII